LRLLVSGFLALAANDEHTQEERTHNKRATTANHQKILPSGWIS
jgi:hypothetical protein